MTLSKLGAVFCVVGVALAGPPSITLRGQIVALETNGHLEGVELAVIDQVTGDAHPVTFGEDLLLEIRAAKGEIVRLRVVSERYGLTRLSTIPGLIRYEEDDVLFHATTSARVILMIAPKTSLHFQAMPVAMQEVYSNVNPSSRN